MLLAKFSKLHKSRPEKLVMTLSISDIIFLDKLIIYIILKEFDTKLCKAYTNAFLFVRNLTHISYFLICLERPNATYAVEITVKKRNTFSQGSCYWMHCMLSRLGSLHSVWNISVSKQLIGMKYKWFKNQHIVLCLYHPNVSYTFCENLQQTR